jgi:hypothetical protein
MGPKSSHMKVAMRQNLQSHILNKGPKSSCLKGAIQQNLQAHMSFKEQAQSQVI